MPRAASNPDDAIVALASSRHLPHSHLARWLAMDERSRGTFLDFAESLRLRTGQIVHALDLLDEIAVREGKSAADILAAPDLARISQRSGSAPGRARAFIEGLHAMRFPRLAQTAARLESAIGELRLPRGISIVLPKELGSDVLTIKLEVSRADDLDRAARILAERRAALARILELLGGSDEV
ncbi:MAG: hypothetical protein ACYDC3_07535 [Candidatus Binataceae bacterium]